MAVTKRQAQRLREVESEVRRLTGLRAQAQADRYAEFVRSLGNANLESRVGDEFLSASLLTSSRRSPQH